MLVLQVSGEHAALISEAETVIAWSHSGPLAAPGLSDWKAEQSRDGFKPSAASHSVGQLAPACNAGDISDLWY